MELLPPRLLACSFGLAALTCGIALAACASEEAMNRTQAIDVPVDAAVAEDVESPDAATATCAPIGLEAYRSTTCFCGDACDCYFDVPYGDRASWHEQTTNSDLRQAIDIYLPKGQTAKTPLVFYAHANGNTKALEPGASAAKNIGQPLLERGVAFASVEFRHPYTNKDVSAPQMDLADATQFLRCHAEELNVDAPRMAAVGRSRGTLALLGALSNDRADSTSAKPEARESTRLRGVWGLNAQTSYWGKWIGETFYSDDTRGFFYAYYSQENFGHAIGEVTADDPPIHLSYDGELVTLPIDAGQCKQIGGTLDCVHLPNFGDEMCKAYAAAGIPDKCVTDYKVDLDTVDVVPFLMNVLAP